MLSWAIFGTFLGRFLAQETTPITPQSAIGKGCIYQLLILDILRRFSGHFYYCSSVPNQTGQKFTQKRRQKWPKKQPEKWLESIKLPPRCWKGTSGWKQTKLEPFTKRPHPNMSSIRQLSCVRNFRREPSLICTGRWIGVLFVEFRCHRSFLDFCISVICILL